MFTGGFGVFNSERGQAGRPSGASIRPVATGTNANGNKNDDNDVETLCEAVERPNIRFVPLNLDFQFEFHRPNLQTCAVMCVYAGFSAIRPLWRCTPFG